MSDLTTARSFQDLLQPDVPPSSYDYATLFSGEGFFARRRAKRRFKLLKKIDPRLRLVLKPEESVFFATTGTTVSVAESFFVGTVAYYLNNRSILFTTDRILLLQIDSRHRPRDLVSQIRYEEISAITSTWNGICQIRLRNGKKLKFQRVPRAERKFLKEFLKDVVKPSPLQPGEQVRAPEHLCPVCFTMIPGHPKACPPCGAPFKSARVAGLLSLVFPGLGDLYIGHRTIALLEMCGGAFLWFTLVIVPLRSAGTIDPDTDEAMVFDSAYWISTAILLGAAHLIDAAMTRHFALKGHYPASRKARTAPPARPQVPSNEEATS